ncbi:MAG: MFS transporter [Coriobacteriia bacterium]
MQRPDIPTSEANVEGPPQGILGRFKTFESLGYRDFRYFLTGAFLSNVGTWMQNVALGWLVYQLTRSSLTLGVVNFLSGAPIFVFILFAGAVADRVDRRRLIIWLQVVMMAQAALFGVLTQTSGITMAWVYGLTLVGGAASAFTFPAWQATVPDLVPRKSLLNAIALNAAQFNGARLVGPMIGALIFARFGVTEVFYANAVSFLAVIAALAVIHPRQTRPEKTGESGWRNIAAGLRYVRHERDAAVLLSTQAMVTIFGMPFTTLMPVVAVETLHVKSSGYAMLMAANGLGALVGALVIASLPATVRRDRIVRAAVLVMSLGLIGIALSRSFVLTAGLLVVIGGAFLASTSGINTSLQAKVPPELRGRVMALFVLAFMGVMPFGALAFGALGRAVGAATAIGAGAAVLLVYAIWIGARGIEAGR